VIFPRVSARCLVLARALARVLTYQAPRRAHVFPQPCVFAIDQNEAIARTIRLFAPRSLPRDTKRTKTNMAPRITYKRRHAYNTRSNKIVKKRLPGGSLGIAYVKKTTKGAQTPAGDAGRIHGVRVDNYSSSIRGRGRGSARRGARGRGDVDRCRRARAFVAIDVVDATRARRKRARGRTRAVKSILTDVDAR